MCWKCYRNIAIEVVEAEGRYLVLYLGPDCYVVGCIKYFKYLPTYVVESGCSTSLAYLASTEQVLCCIHVWLS